MSITFDTFCHNVIFNTKILCRYRGKLVCMQRGNRNCVKQQLHIVFGFCMMLHARITRDADCYGQNDKRGIFWFVYTKRKTPPRCRQTRIRTTTKYRSEANGDLFDRRKVPVESLGCIWKRMMWPAARDFYVEKDIFRRNTDVFQGKMTRRTAKRPAVRVRWEFSDTT